MSKAARRFGACILAGLMAVSLINVASPAESVEAAEIVVREGITETAASGNIIIGVEGVDVTSAQKKLLDRINEVRYSACTDGKTPDPRDKKRMLTEDDYVPMKIGVNCTKTALLRAAEASFCLGHQRPTGDKWSVVTKHYNTLAKSMGENLAWNSDRASDIEGWIDERDAYLGLESGQTGHYETLINPKYVYTGMATFNPSNDNITYGSYKPDWSCTAGSYADKDTEVTEYAQAMNLNVVQKVEVPVASVDEMEISGDSILNTGSSDTAKLLVSVTYKKSDELVADCTTTDCPVYDGVTWTSSDSDVITIDSSGQINAKASGIATITASIGTGSSIKQVKREFMVIPKGVSITGAEDPEMITVDTHTKPSLPKTVKVKLSNGTSIDANVDWDDYDSSELNTNLKSNEFNISGNAKGYSVVQKVHVNAATVTAVYTEPKTIETKSGVKPDYPKAKLFLSSGLYYYDLYVDWDAESLEYYKLREGGTFIMNGVTSYAFDTDEGKKQYPVSMTLKVTPATYTDVYVDESPISTASGVEPVYPKATVTWSNGDKTKEDITWTENEDFLTGYKKKSGGFYTITGVYGDKNVTVRVNVTPAVVSSIGFDDSDIIVENGTAPVLPQKAKVTWSNGEIENSDIAWETIAESKYTNTTGGEFTVSGTVEGEKVSVKCKVSPPNIDEVDALSDVSTIEGVAPKLPAQVKVNWNNGMSTVENIVWNDIDDTAYGSPGKNFTVKGSLKEIDGTDDIVSVIVNVKAKSLMTFSWKALPDEDEQETNPSGTVFYGKYDWTKINGTLVAKYNNNTSEEIDINDERVTVTGFDPESKKTTQKVALSYSYGKGSDAVTKTVYLDLMLHLPKSLNVTNPLKTVYVEGQEFDGTGFVVVTVYDDGTIIDPNKGKEIPEYVLSGFDSSVIGTQTVTVTQDGLSESFEVKVIKRAAASITVSDIHPQKIGTKLNLDDVAATITFNDGAVENYKLSELIADAKAEITGYDRDTLGVQTIRIKYEKVSCNAEIIVKDKVVTGVSVTDIPKKVNYIEGTELDLTGGMLRITYDNDTYDDVDIVKEMVTGFDKNKIGIQVIEVSVDGKSDSFSVNVKAKQIVTRYLVKPKVISYVEGMALDLFGGCIYTLYDNETEERLELGNNEIVVKLMEGNAVVDDVTKLKAGEYTLKIKYKGDDIKTEDDNDITITVKASVEDAKATVGDGNSVTFSSDADQKAIRQSLEGMVLNVPCADGTTVPVEITSDMIETIDNGSEDAGTSSDDGFETLMIKIRVGTKTLSNEELTSGADDGIYVFLPVKVEKKKVSDKDDTHTDKDDKDNGDKDSGDKDNGDKSGNDKVEQSGGDVSDKTDAGQGDALSKEEVAKPSVTTITKLTARRKSFVVKWKKTTANVKGYQISYSLNKKFKKNTKLVNISKSTIVSKKIKKLKSGKKYYVRIRTYNKSGDKTLYSAWSKTKTVKVK